jgi:hypothetical protein
LDRQILLDSVIVAEDASIETRPGSGTDLRTFLIADTRGYTGFAPSGATKEVSDA